MQYVVSIENTSYYYWQIELLIESFIMQGLQDNLIIAIADNSVSKIRGYSKNIINHTQKIIHENYGKNKNFLPLNRINAVRNLLYSGILKTPFAIIHADMILRNPLQNDDSYDVIINNYNAIRDSSINNYLIESGLRDELLEKKLSENIIDNFYFSMPVVFNKSINQEFLLKFFDKLVVNTENFLEKQSQNKSKFVSVDKLCWTYNFLEALGFYSLKGTPLTAELFTKEESNASFLHYNRGIPPVFYKRSFDFSDSKFRINFDPYETLLENSFTKNSEFLSRVINSYRKM